MNKEYVYMFNSIKFVGILLILTITCAYSGSFKLKPLNDTTGNYVIDNPYPGKSSNILFAGMFIRGGISITKMKGRLIDRYVENPILKLMGHEVTVDNEYFFSSTLGFRWEFTEYSGVKLLNLQSELTYVQNGMKISDSYRNSESIWKFSYLDIQPILLKLDAPSKKFIPNIIAGPYLGIKLKATIEEDGDKIEPEEATLGEFGITLGGGVSIRTSNGAILIDSRYNMGLSSVFDRTKVDETADKEESQVLTRTLILSIGYEFRNF